MSCGSRPSVTVAIDAVRRCGELAVVASVPLAAGRAASVTRSAIRTGEPRVASRADLRRAGARGRETAWRRGARGTDTRVARRYRPCGKARHHASRIQRGNAGGAAPSDAGARRSRVPTIPGLIACWPGVREDRMATACAELARPGICDQAGRRPQYHRRQAAHRLGGLTASQTHIAPSTPMGANLIGDGATFRVWAPRATHVYVALGGADDYQPRPQDELVKDPATGHWTGFFAGVADGTKYRFFVVGPGGSGLQARPVGARARAVRLPRLRLHRARPGLVPVARRRTSGRRRSTTSSSTSSTSGGSSRATTRAAIAGRDAWRSSSTRSTASSTSPTSASTRCSRCRVVEFAGEWSLGYNGTDIFSPEMDYGVDPADLAPYLRARQRACSRRRDARR